MSYDNLTSLIFPSRLLQVFKMFFQAVDILGQAVRTQLVEGLWTDLLDVVRFLHVVYFETSFIYRFNCRLHGAVFMHSFIRRDFQATVTSINFSAFVHPWWESPSVF